MRNALRILGMLYLGAGLFAASLIHAAIPPLNFLGFTYIAATWPALIYCTPEDRGCTGMPPEWAVAYLFEEEKL
jgi:hypothetical protein